MGVGELTALYRRFARYWAQLAEIEGSAPRGRSNHPRPFCGQPDLAGVLLCTAEYDASINGTGSDWLGNVRFCTGGTGIEPDFENGARDNL